MKHLHRHHYKVLRIGRGVKAAVLVGLLGIVAVFVDGTFVTAAEHAATETSVSVAPGEPASPMVAQRAGTRLLAGAPAERPYPEPGDPARDDDNHPPSF